MGSYQNGTKVNIQGMKGEYQIMTSSLSWNTPSSGELMLLYHCVNSFGNKVSSPHCYITPLAAEAS